MLLKLLAVELLKVRRSLALLMMFAIALMVVALNVLMLVKQYPLAAMGPAHWLRLWQNSAGLWCYFMLPLYIALVTGLLNGQEHRNHTWRLMLTLPVTQLQLFAVKALLAWLFVAGATLVLGAGTALSMLVLGAAGASLDGAFAFPVLAALGKATLGCLPVLVIQHAVSWRFQNLTAPLAVGVVATMGITQVGSSSYWVWYPWTYATMAVMGSEAASRQQALALAAGVGALLFAAAAAALARREVES
ncbi:ABC transporter permease [Massilia sp. PAMC28688]|uniref:ABC transporter permease n=1 Tax=Massilia sp. PAMC28688 TaxID=2861283 RepID=UPI001C6308E1|nr:ABC transporter permease [Massilia sp. PAMC28688]QYF92413.1 ABC transporter permease [Massilia sp. PAMC28688]